MYSSMVLQKNNIIMIEKTNHIKELYNLNHINDDLLHIGYDYETKLFNNLLSRVMFKNKNLAEFLNILQKNVIWLIDSTLPIRNFYNYTVSKYYNNHNN